ncbi:flagellar basal body M-ring protein FliF [Pseudidiomarina aestuarii]|uniref:Flagellar M-ring protein n=1 Tax=Pseudidiomarina aestuarii TaxID=624146 RepID=A0A7Z7EUK7_9GAMM|nr:flagellar basal-body MS-ring/collar protein FliF [Pseudidiomarina aestuarii]RUO42145.1 flagellar basal body M-ring protein FliF [Pseudidiomarina aestuarii]
MEATQTATAGVGNNVNQWFGKLKASSLVPLLLGGAAFLGLIIALSLWVSAPDYRVLYSNLSEADGGRIVNELETRQIPYQLNGTNTLLVPADQVHRLRLQLAEQGLPQGGNAGFSLMDNQAFGISQFAEQVNFQRALEGELASSMESLGPVAKARVHLAMAKASVFVREREPAKASVVLTLHTGRSMGDGQVNAIIHMVSSSVPELTPDSVTVVDQHGNLLSDNNRDDALSGTKLSYIQQVEKSYQERIEGILAPFLGRENIQAQVAASINFATREATAERYSPNQTPETAAIRSIQRNLSMQGMTDGAAGVPGALSNTPPGVAASPIETDPTGAENSAGTVANGNAVNNTMQQDQVVNYEVDRLVEHVQHERGELERISIAVVVNHRQTTDEEGIVSWVPRSEEELDYINRLVRQAVGFNVERGDQIEVVNSRFMPVADETEVEVSGWQDPATQQLAFTIGKYVAAGLGILLFYLLIMRPLLNRHVQSPIQSPVDSTGTARASGRGNLRAVVGDDDDNNDGQRRTGHGSSSNESSEEEELDWPDKTSQPNYTRALNKAKQHAAENPKQVARILQNWISKDDAHGNS